MKTYAELEQWRDGAEREFGDASAPTGLLFARFINATPDEYVQDVAHGVAEMFGEGPAAVVVCWDGKDLFLLLFDERLRLALDPSAPRLGLSGELRAFGIDEVVPGLWSLAPSLNLPEILHVFVVLYNVPIPAPWERLVASSPVSGELLNGHQPH